MPPQVAPLPQPSSGRSAFAAAPLASPSAVLAWLASAGHLLQASRCVLPDAMQEPVGTLPWAHLVVQPGAAVQASVLVNESPLPQQEAWPHVADQPERRLGRANASPQRREAVGHQGQWLVQQPEPPQQMGPSVVLRQYGSARRCGWYSWRKVWAAD